MLGTEKNHLRISCFWDKLSTIAYLNVQVKSMCTDGVHLAPIRPRPASPRRANHQPNQPDERGGRHRSGRDQGVRQGVQTAPAVAGPHTDAGRPGAVRHRGSGVQSECHLQVREHIQSHTHRHTFTHTHTHTHTFEHNMRRKWGKPGHFQKRQNSFAN